MDGMVHANTNANAILDYIISTENSNLDSDSDSDGRRRGGEGRRGEDELCDGFHISP